MTDPTHPLDSATTDTMLVGTEAGIVTISPTKEASPPDESDPLHGALPIGATLRKTAQGIEVQVETTALHAIWGVEATVAEAVRWLEREWNKMHGPKAA